MSKEKFELPAGKRIAVVLSVLLETWSDTKYPSYFPRTSPLGQGKVDLAAINWSRFGGVEGIWRVNNLLKQSGLRGTLFCNGRSAEVYSEAVKQWVANGNVLAGHGYFQDQLLAYLEPQDEQLTIQKSLRILDELGRQKTAGWVTPIYGWTEHTAKFLAQEGVIWSCDTMDMSMPRVSQVGGGNRLVMFPWSDFMDNRVRNHPHVYFETYKDTFDYLRKFEPNGLLNIGVHTHFGGRPLMAAQFMKLIEYMQSFDDVWFATHTDVANLALQHAQDATTYKARFF